ncbi:signal peptidase I [bacterium CG2_30_54_10]|nr:MAG: signal peptidase I [bacterium CG2_30_54_10]
MIEYMETFKDWLKDFFKALIFFFILQTYVVQGFVIEGACMEPQLHTAEKIMVNKFVYHLWTPVVGEVIVFSFPLDPRKDFIKRVIGKSGDLLEIKNGFLYRNDRRVAESFVKEYVFGSYGPLRVPAGKVCVMGDNRNNSHDSRAWGFLDISQVKGRAEFKFWPPWSLGLIQSISE